MVCDWETGIDPTSVVAAVCAAALINKAVVRSIVRTIDREALTGDFDITHTSS
jgi:hypothetical protein